jgi:hypothetical protein
VPIILVCHAIPRPETSYILHITNCMEKSPSGVANSHSASQIPRLLWTRRFITVFTTAHHWSLSWAKRIQSTSPHPISQRSILILSSHMLLVLLIFLYPLGFQTKTCQFLISYACYMSHPSYPSWFHNPNNILWSLQVIKFLIMQSFLASLRSKYSSQHPVLKHPQSMFCP